MRLYNADEGNIAVNKTPIEQLSVKEWREQIGYVPQDVFLFSDTVKENIEFGNNNPSTMELIEQIASVAAVDKEIESFEKQYETVIGERGVTLSGGQKQRIAISRALMKDANLYLFDDCFSAVDNITEKKIGTALTSFLQHKSAIFISHRIFREFVFDKIVVLDDGSIVEQGTHHELIQLNGYYAATYTAQMNN
jgi:ATP-binding cassette subfamily B protein